MSQNTSQKQVKISKIGITNDKITGRGGLNLFIKYLDQVRFFQLFGKHLGFLKGSSKGLSLSQFLKQICAHFMDGTQMSMTDFDNKEYDAAYAAIIENHPSEMASSHQIKRFFRKFIGVGNSIFRTLLLWLFIWRLRIEQPELLILFGDTMVLDNDDAKQRQGVEPTYKRKKGYHPLQFIWNGYVVDALFRSGSVHGNHEREFAFAVARLVRAIRKHYRDVPIILTTDSAFFDEKNFTYFEKELKIHYICAGKFYEDIKTTVSDMPMHQFVSNSARPVRRRHADGQSGGEAVWQYADFGDRRQSWERFRRLIFTRLISDEQNQMVFDFAGTESLIYTNIGMAASFDEKLVCAGGIEYLQAENIIYLNHQRGKSELVHRSIKEFATKEQLPFFQIGMNRAYYYFMVLCHFMWEAFKRDVSADILSTSVYPGTFRRLMIDFAAKIVSRGGQLILKVTAAVYEQLNLSVLWNRCLNAPPIFVE